MPELKQCPNCGGFPKLHRKGNRVFYECNGDCWTRTHAYYDEADAAKEWNNLKKSEKAEMLEGMNNGTA